MELKGDCSTGLLAQPYKSTAWKALIIRVALPRGPTSLNLLIYETAFKNSGFSVRSLVNGMSISS